MNTEHPSLSIIVPAYQAEKTINRAMNSVLGYQGNDFELIVVDDGSLDRTGAIVEKKASEDGRIRTIKQTNSGRSMARNAGLEVARGKWVAFLDSDDEYISSGLAAMVAKSEKCSGGVWGGFTSPNGARTFSNDGDVLSSSIGLNRILHPCSRAMEARNEDGTLYRSVWGKIYSRDVIERAHIRFSIGLRFGEDALFNLRYLAAVEEVLLLFEPVYYYDVSSSSTAGEFSRDDGGYLLAFARAAEGACRGVSNTNPSELIGNEAMSVFRKAACSRSDSREIESLLSAAYADPAVLRGIEIAQSRRSFNNVVNKAETRLIAKGHISSAVKLDRAILALKRLTRR